MDSKRRKRIITANAVAVIAVFGMLRTLFNTAHIRTVEMVAFTGWGVSIGALLVNVITLFRRNNANPGDIGH